MNSSVSHILDLILEKDVFQSTLFVINDLKAIEKWSSLSLISLHNNKDCLLQDVNSIYIKNGYKEKYIYDLVKRFSSFIDVVLKPYRVVISVVEKQENEKLYNKFIIKDFSEYVFFFEAISNLRLSKELKAIIVAFKNIAGDKYSFRDYLDREIQCKSYVKKLVKKNFTVYEEFEKIIDKILNIPVVNDKNESQENRFIAINNTSSKKINDNYQHSCVKNFYNTLFSYKLSEITLCLLSKTINKNTKNKTILDYNFNNEGFKDHIKSFIGLNNIVCQEIDKIVRVEVRLIEKKSSNKKGNTGFNFKNFNSDFKGCDEVNTNRENFDDNKEYDIEMLERNYIDRKKNELFKQMLREF